MIKPPEQLSEFDFFMDEDVRSRRIGVLCLEKRLTPALTQALFRVRENALQYHHDRVRKLESENGKKMTEELSSVYKQIREIKWSELNLMRSFIANEFLHQFFHYWDKGPLPIMFFNTPFKENHFHSINYFFESLKHMKIDVQKTCTIRNRFSFWTIFQRQQAISSKKKSEIQITCHAVTGLTAGRTI